MRDFLLTLGSLFLICFGASYLDWTLERESIQVLVAQGIEMSLRNQLAYWSWSAGPMNAVVASLVAAFIASILFVAGNKMKR